MVNVLIFHRILKSAPAAAIAVGLAAACFFLAAADAAELMDVRFGPSAAQTRIVFDLDGGSDYAVSGDATGQGRVFVDFADLTLKDERPRFRDGKGHVARYGFARIPGGGARAVVELEKTSRIKAAFMIPPGGGVSKHRLVIDLESADKSAFLASLPARGQNRYPDLAAVIEQATAGRPAPDAPPRLTVPPAPTQKEAALRAAPANAGSGARPDVHPNGHRGDIKVVVIDPGHGGVDPGAQGQNGTYEKTVNLAAALELEKILEVRGGYDVVLTRRGDDTLRPDRREALAREAGADLFISIHADAIPQPQIRGASVYTLSEKGVARSANLARAQGNFHIYDLDLKEYDEVVSDILFDKAQESTNTASATFARLLLDELSGKTPMLNRSHRTANLRVLLAPDVPAVLLEMAFISNARDEKNLNSPTWRSTVMTAAADAIDAYFMERYALRLANTADGVSH